MDPAKYDTYALPAWRAHEVRVAGVGAADRRLDGLRRAGPTSAEPPGGFSAASVDSAQPSLKLKLQYALHTLVLVAVAAVFFAFLSLSRMDSLERLTPNISSLPKNHLSRITWEVEMSVSLATLLSSSAAFFIATLQLFFGLKIAKSNPGSTMLTGSCSDCPPSSSSSSSPSSSSITLVVALIIIPTPLGVIPRGIACAVGIALVLFCIAAAAHSLHTLFRLDDLSRADVLGPAALAYAQHYSTLV
ncbi:hypothetical protein M3Y99_01103200 [Aphelenchoides fujianensis]|nr:hypothetical protein M3Y99_01103200 [Aphelenchoides fujianensis]